jgi:MarR family
MTPTDEATFIALWTAGTETSEIAERLGIPKGTVQSRAHRLQQRGLIQPRPRGRVLSESAGAGPAGGNPTPTRAVRRAHPRGPRDHHGSGPGTVGIDHALQWVRGAGGCPGGRHLRGHPHPTRTHEPTRGHPYPWDHQAMDRAVVATPHRGGEGAGHDRGEGAEPSRGAAAVDRADRPASIDALTDFDTGKASRAQAKESPRWLSNTWCCKRKRRMVRLPA